ncbi:phosphoenolpyruvate carboxylase [Alkalihalobacillus hemicentroti]|uniref:Phosphoenolpyruvate carboxylase n=2 Tax=Guptibacillus hwajinpoensis TaxID=208199 RepID=A0ABU0K1Q1_9BACL|nr:phosphoenolpyruvate carboxylase [Alkalihalobacillus hemicentroti]MDQ0483209.1 phosphoenolpyruvate carboxylase [Alkalihalobacillus hemicentroti]
MAMDTDRSTQQSHHVALRRDISMLGSLLGDVLVQHGGKELLDMVESIREKTKSLRQEVSLETSQELKGMIHTLKQPMRKQVIRAFALYFHLVNIAEQNHRIRRRRDYQMLEEDQSQPGSIPHAIALLKKNNVPGELIEDTLSSLSLELILTAHPTEATRRSVLEIHKRIAVSLQQLDNPLLTKREQKVLKEELLNEITTLWQTDELRHKKPTVMDEVNMGLFYFEETLFEVLPQIHQELEECLHEHYPDAEWRIPNILKFGSWIGGDRDGNPFVTPQVTWNTLERQRDVVLSKYKKSIKDLMRKLSQSTNRIPICGELIASIERDQGALPEVKPWGVSHEAYRVKLTYVLEKLNRINTDKGYSDVENFIEDLKLIANSLRQHHPERYHFADLTKLIRQASLFGFHLATLDIRNHSGEHEAAIAEVFERVNVADDYASLPEEEKVQLLSDVLEDPRPVLSTYEDYSEKTRKILDIFNMIKKAHREFGVDSISVYLISMTQSASDLLEVLVLAKEANIYRMHSDGSIESDLNIAPLLETIDDLKAGPSIMKTLFDLPVYKKHLEKLGNRQEIMLGYSDGSKDGGTLTANWKLYEAQQEISGLASERNLRLKFFHGRGGALGRGGGPLRRSLLSQPPETYTAGVKITEQGEVLSSRYLLYDIAYRSLEQATTTLLTSAVSGIEKDKRQEKWQNAMEHISNVSLKTYQSLVFQDEGFLAYFKQGTPLPELSALNIGSRPMSRKGTDHFEDLRAIPWVFAWTQSRQLMPAWYASGTGLTEFASTEDGLHTLQEMYENWPFFASLIDNLQMGLMKADLTTAEKYMDLIDDQQLSSRIFGKIVDEYHQTKNVILTITGQDELLDGTPNIKDSIRLRNPYVDPLSSLQVELISTYRADGSKDDELLKEILLTINGIAAGLRNTG